MMLKKAQSQIITTVLIILLVLAAIVIVWQVVRTTVTEGTDTLTERTACMGLNMEITNYSLTPVGNNISVKLTRNAGGPDANDEPLTLVLLVDGITVAYSEDAGTTTVGQLESKTLTGPNYATTPAKVEVGGKMGDVACDYVACLGDC